MSEEVKVLKKRGRPKKVVDADTVVIINNSVDGNSHQLQNKPRKTTVRKTAAKSIDTDSWPKKRVIKKTTAKNEIDGSILVLPDSKAQTGRTRKDAKSSAIDDIVTQSTAPSTSNILDQATAFKDRRGRDLSAAKVEEIQRHPDAIVTETESKKPRAVQPSNQHKLDELQATVTDLSQSSRQLSINYIELRLLQISHDFQQGTDFATRLKSQLRSRITTASRVETFHHQTRTSADTIQDLFSSTQELLQNRRRSQISASNTQVASLVDSIQQTGDLIKSFQLTQLAQTHKSRHTQELASRVHSLDKDIRTSTMMLEYCQSSLQTRQQYIKMRQPTHPPPPPSSQPINQASSLASMSTSSRPQQKQPRPQQPPPKPRPLRPTEQPYDVLVKNPAFKQQSRKWVSFIVGIPVIFASSWALFNVYQDTLRRRDFERNRNDAAGAARGIGVDRSSNVGVNGGV